MNTLYPSRSSERFQFYWTLSIFVALFPAYSNAQVFVDTVRKHYITDGANQDFVWARQLSPTKLAIGLLEKQGFFELVNDTTIWLKGVEQSGDRLVSNLSQDETTKSILFYYKSDNPNRTKVDTLGFYNPADRTILDSKGVLVGTISVDGDVINAQNEALLSIHQVDELLSSFFIVRYYLPQVKIRQQHENHKK